ncbi:DUF4339 domain-containing protein [Marinicauda pacifica]|uniref:DUF4339 domain-containing protein n=1 Tax=Marinicauda pacifica TaxID=1133559 RepID=A0A4S2H7P8_9PROT|nr:DUF4339 domain-containing protein [Marinicauda pacifica]
MPRDDASATSWFVRVEGRVYGPYTPAQMHAFVKEGRVAAHSTVSQSREAGWLDARQVDQFKGWFDEARQTPAQRRPRPAPGDARTANFVVIAHLSQESEAEFAAALSEFGDTEQIGHGVWLVRAPYTAAILRNELSHALSRDDKLLVVDASRDRTAWFNLGREADQRIRELWGRPQ